MHDTIFPVLNAALNAASALLIATGVILIRYKRSGAHKAAMLAAVVTSSVFLVSYLYYHLVVMHGHPTRFQGHGWSRPVYFAILGSHTILAAAVVPFVLVTVLRALRGRFDRHRASARWTYPIWLYVSVTGVVIYWMLYHEFVA